MVSKAAITCIFIFLLFFNFFSIDVIAAETLNEKIESEKDLLNEPTEAIQKPSDDIAINPSFNESEIKALKIKIDNLLLQDNKEINEKNRFNMWESMKKRLINPRPAFQAHKLNYFILNNMPYQPNSQVKFQFSAKYRLSMCDCTEFERNIYLAYTQKSLWNVPEDPKFEESNYDPEAFIEIIWRDYDKIILDIGFEHESNGTGGIDERSWNRVYIKGSYGRDRMVGMKLWLPVAESYERQNEYLESNGSNQDFIDYAGYGEVFLYLSDPLGFVGGLFTDRLPELRVIRPDRLDVKGRIGGKTGWELGLQKAIKDNFNFYIQYWNGYGETLSKFDKHEQIAKLGISFTPYKIGRPIYEQ